MLHSYSDLPQRFSLLPVALEITLDGKKIVISAEDIIEHVHSFFNIGLSNIPAFGKEDDIRKPPSSAYPIHWLKEAVGLKTKQHIDYIKLEDATRRLEKVIDTLIETKNLMTMAKYFDYQRGKFNTYEEHKDFSSLMKNKKEYRQFKGQYYQYIEQILDEAIAEKLIPVPQEATPLQFYNLGENIISIGNPSKRYAAVWGSFDFIIEKRELIEERLKRDSRHISDNSESSVEPAEDVAEYFSNKDLKRLRRQIDRVINEDTRKHSRRRLKEEQLRETYEHAVEAEGGPPYSKIEYEIRRILSEYPAGKLENSVRAILKGSSDQMKKGTSLLAAVWFLSEVSRNPSSLLSSLILLDFIHESLPYEIMRENGNRDTRCYSWDSALWDGSNPEWGGTHPMCHYGSYLELESNPRNLGNSKLSVVRQKEAALILRWLSYKLDKKYGAHLILREHRSEPSENCWKNKQSLQQVKLSNAEAEILKKAFLKDVVTTLFKRRINSFDYMPVQDNSLISQESKSVPTEKLPERELHPPQMVEADQLHRHRHHTSSARRKGTDLDKLDGFSPNHERGNSQKASSLSYPKQGSSTYLARTQVPTVLKRGQSTPPEELIDFPGFQGGVAKNAQQEKRQLPPTPSVCLQRSTTSDCEPQIGQASDGQQKTTYSSKFYKSCSQNDRRGSPQVGELRPQQSINTQPIMNLTPPVPEMSKPNSSAELINNHGLHNEIHRNKQKQAQPPQVLSGRLPGPTSTTTTTTSSSHGAQGHGNHTSSGQSKKMDSSIPGNSNRSRGHEKKYKKDTEKHSNSRGFNPGRRN